MDDLVVDDGPFHAFAPGLHLQLKPVGLAVDRGGEDAGPGRDGGEFVGLGALLQGFPPGGFFGASPALGQPRVVEHDHGLFAALLQLGLGQVVLAHEADPGHPAVGQEHAADGEGLGLAVAGVAVAPQATGKHAGLVALFVQAAALFARVQGALAVFAALELKEVQLLGVATVDAFGQGVALGAALEEGFDGRFALDGG